MAESPIFQWYWLGQRAFLYYQIDYAGATTTRRYLQSDEQGRPLAAWSWPTTGNTGRVWCYGSGCVMPDISTSNTYSIFQWYWLNDRPVAYYQIDYPNATTTRRFLESDEQNRPLAAWDWPTSGSATRVWEVDPGLFGWDEVTVGANLYQPIRFPGQLYDEDTEAWADDQGATLKRPGICYNRYRSYDSFTGTYLQSDPLVGGTWDAYGYVSGNPVMRTDPTGLLMSRYEYCSAVATYGFGGDYASFLNCMNGVGGCLPGTYGDCMPGGYGGQEEWNPGFPFPSDWPWGQGCLGVYLWIAGHPTSPFRAAAWGLLCSQCPGFSDPFGIQTVCPFDYEIPDIVPYSEFDSSVPKPDPRSGGTPSDSVTTDVPPGAFRPTRLLQQQ